jgi:hypothetical protein
MEKFNIKLFSASSSQKALHIYHTLIAKMIIWYNWNKSYSLHELPFHIINSSVKFQLFSHHSTDIPKSELCGVLLCMNSSVTEHLWVCCINSLTINYLSNSTVLLLLKVCNSEKNAVSWDITPCGSCKNRHFGGI